MAHRCSPTWWRRSTSRWPAGAPSTGYGLTETHGIVTANAGALYVAKPSSCGRVVPTLEWKLVDELGDEVARDAVGELCVRGSVVIKGYLNRPEATAEGIPNGWFHTGDIARVDEDGFVFIVDRAKDMVLRGGENVYCSEVEAAIYEHPGVAEVAVFGVPDDRLGEIVAAAIVLAPGATPHRGRTPRRTLRHGWRSSRSPSGCGSSTSRCRATPTASSSSASCGRTCSPNPPDRATPESASA